MRFVANKLKLVSIYSYILVCGFYSVALANELPTSNPWVSYGLKSSLIDAQNFTSQFEDQYLSQLATKGARWQLDKGDINKFLLAQFAEFELAIPLPNGSLEIFKLKPVSVMAAKLAEKYPQLLSFKGTQINNKHNTGRFDYSPDGFSGLFRYNGQWVILATNKQSTKTEYISYYTTDEIKRESLPKNRPDYLNVAKKYSDSLSAKALSTRARRAVGDQIRTFRIAISASAEYTNANGGEASAMAEIVRLVNRINQILLVDLAMQFELVDNNDRLIFTNPNTDPFTNTDAHHDIEANQDIIDQLIGSQNYDLGHVLNTDPGGLATLESACKTSSKAKTQSGSSRPSGESFYLQLVIHELGHQLGALHTFNALDQNNCDETQRIVDAAVEPGSGSTIMSYAGLCGEQNIEQESGGYYHAFSIEQIQSYLAGRSCGTSLPSGNDVPNISTSPIKHSIPASTPFVLTANASDNDGDSLSYTWDQVDPGGFDGATTSLQERETDNGANPLFRSNPPTSNPSRYFPKLTDVVNNTDSDGEVMPTQARQMNFELVVRDGKGGVNTLEAEVNIVQTGKAFSIIQPQASTPTSTVEWTGGQLQDVEWNTADTELPPISCTSVDILLDADGDNSFETTLAFHTDNDGAHQVVSPNTNSTRARLMVRCSNSIFYTVNPGQFALLPGAVPVAPLITGQVNKTSQEDSSLFILLPDLSVDDPDTNYPENFTLQIEQGSNYSFSGHTVMPNSNFNGALTVNVSVNDGISDSNIFPFVAQIIPINDRPIAVDDGITINQDAGSTSIDVLINDNDPDQDTLTITEVSYSGSGQVAIASNRVSYSPAAGFFGTESITYSIEDPSFATSSATLTITVIATPITPTPIPNPTPTPTSPSLSGKGGGSIGHLLILLTLGFLVSMSSACVKSSPTEKSPTNTKLQSNDLTLQAAQQDAKLAAQNLDFRVLGFVRKLISLPGIDQTKYSAQWVEKHCGIRILKGVTDTVEIGQDLSHQKALRIYAETYNQVIFKSCQIFQKDYSE